MSYRCEYNLSDKVVLGGTVGAEAGEFDDAEHGTTVEFDGEPPVPQKFIYDTGTQQLVANPVYGSFLDLSSLAIDTDGDGIADIIADDVETDVITIQKKDADGNDLTGAEHNDTVFLSITAGSLEASLLSLVNGVVTVILAPSADVACEVVITVSSNEPGVRKGSIRLKYIEEIASSSS